MFSSDRKKLDFYNMEELQPIMTTIFTDIILLDREYGKKKSMEEYNEKKKSRRLDRRDNFRPD